MRKWIAVFALVIASLALSQFTWAGSPTSQTLTNRENFIDITVGQTADIAADVIDTTTVIDMSKALWMLDSSDLPFLYVRLQSTTMAAGESLTVTIDASADGTVWDGDAAASQVLVASETMMIELVEFGRFMRIRILNQDDDAHDYDLLIQAPAK